MFQVKNEKITTLLKDIGELLKRRMPPNWGFTLLIFDFTPEGKTGGNLFYISAAKREDMIATMKNMIAHLEGRNHEQTTNRTM